MDAQVVLAKRTPFKIEPIVPRNGRLARSRAQLAKAIGAFFKAEAPRIANQVTATFARFGKADLTSDEQAAVDAALAEINFAGWTVLAGDVRPILEAIVRDAGVAALAQIHFDTETNPEVMNIVNGLALDYAEERSAEMVGMRVDELGQLIANPNAKWQITDATRDFLRADVTKAMEEGWSNQRLAKEIGDSYGFSNDRAMTIARTETSMASNTGALNGYKASGVVDGKQWITAEDDLVSEECAANGEAGPNGDGVLLDLDAVYPSGDDAPPVHPNCRCAVIPYINWNEPGPATAAADTGEE